MEDTQFKKLIKEALTPSFLKESVNEASKGDEELKKLKDQAKKFDKKDIRYKEIQKKIYDLETDKAYGLPGSKAAKKFSESVNEEDPRGGYVDIPTLNKHQDVLNLIRNVENYVSIDVKADLRGAGSSDSGQRYYLTTPSLRNWQDTDIQGLKQAFDKTNDQSQELKFEFRTTDNYDEEPGERSWDAAFIFWLDEKDEGSELYPGTMGDELSAPR